MISVLIADDHAVLRQGLRLILREDPDLQVVGEAASGEEAVTKALALAPDVVLMDIGLPDISGIEAIRRIRAARPGTRILVLTISDRDRDLLGAIQAARPGTRILVLTISDRDRDLLGAIQAGARGYLLKSAEAEEVLHAIRRVATGEAVLPPNMTTRLLDALAEPKPMPEILTDRELEVLRHIARGLANKEIAAALNISQNTVKTHVRQILAKLNVRSRAEAAAYAVRAGLIAED